jgi:hypothetical protein
MVSFGFAINAGYFYTYILIIVCPYSLIPLPIYLGFHGSKSLLRVHAVLLRF